jgi:hypothetical protein
MLLRLDRRGRSDARRAAHRAVLSIGKAQRAMPDDPAIASAAERIERAYRLANEAMER